MSIYLRGEASRVEPIMTVRADQGTLADLSTVDRWDPAEVACVAQVGPPESWHRARLPLGDAERAEHNGSRRQYGIWKFGSVVQPLLNGVNGRRVLSSRRGVGA